MKYRFLILLSIFASMSQACYARGTSAADSVEKTNSAGAVVVSGAKASRKAVSRIGIEANPLEARTNIPKYGPGTEPTYGPEWEFGSSSTRHFNAHDLKYVFENSGIVPDEKHEGQALKKFAAAVREKCGSDCEEKVFRYRGDDVNDSYRFTFKDGYWFEITPDPMIVEIKAKPLTLRELKANRDRIQNFVFDTAREIGLTPSGSAIPIVFPGKAHFNIGTTSSFGEDGTAYLHFLNDYNNTPELALGAMGRDRMDAPSITELPASSRQAYARMVEEVNAGAKLAPKKVAATIMNEVYTHPAVPFFGAEHSEAIGLKNAQRATLEKDRPTEFRAMEMSENFDEFIKMAELMDARVALANEKSALGKKIVYRNTNHVNFTKQELVDAYYTYVTEAHLNYDDYKVLLVEKLKGITPSPVLTGAKGWSSFGFAKGVEGQLDRIATSEWLRDKVFASLSSPEAVKTGKGVSIVKTIFSKIQAVDTPVSTRAALADLLKDLEKSPDWKDQWAVFDRGFNRLGTQFLAEPVIEMDGHRCHSTFVKLVNLMFSKGGN